jgi:hypothetical protein
MKIECVVKQKLEDRNYYRALEERVKEQPKNLAVYTSDPAMDAMAETLNSPPFRPPTPQEVAAELPVPSCACQNARFAVFVWYNPSENEANWYTTMQTPVRPIPVVTHCPFCGDRLPQLIRKNLPEGYPAECYYSSAPQ